MVITRDFLIGFAVGVATGVVGYRLYEQNSGQLQRLVKPEADQNSGTSAVEPELEELVAQKERLEDLIAEKNLLASNG